MGSYENRDYFLAKFSEDDGIPDGVFMLVLPVDSPESGHRGCSGGPGGITVGGAR